MAISAADAIDLYQRLSVRSQFSKLASLHDFPNTFTDNHFYYNPAGPIIDINRLLKPMKVNGVSFDSGGTSSAKSSASDEQGGSSMEEFEEEEEEIDTSSARFQEALARLNECLREDNLAAVKTIQQNNNLSEDEIIVGTGIHLIQKLSGRAETNKKRSMMECPCGCSAKLDYGEKLYIGSGKTWHGELDLRSHGVGVTASRDVTGSTSDSRSNGSDEDDDCGCLQYGGMDAGSTNDAGTDCFPMVDDNGGEYSEWEHRNLAFKLDENQKHVKGMQKVISQAIVFGWTEYNRHRNLSPYIPFIYIDNHGFFILIYNPVKDSLISAVHAIKFIDEALQIPKPLDVYSGIFALWIIINHRIFFQKDLEHNVECDFKRQVAFEHYEELTDFQSVVRNNFKRSPIYYQSCVTFGGKKRKRSSFTE